MKRAAPYLSDQVVLNQLHTLLARGRTTTAELLDHIAEVDNRRLFLPAAYPSMYAYCVGELHLSEDSAYKRIQAARAAARFPAIFEAVAEGRLHLTAVVRLAPYLRGENAPELLAEATHKTKLELEKMLAERFPRPDLPSLVEAIPPSSTQPVPEPLGPGADRLVPEPVGTGATSSSPPSATIDRARVKPLAPKRYAVQFTMSQRAHDRLRYFQDLLGHEVPSGDIAGAFERAVELAICQLERRKFAATEKPRRIGRSQPRRSSGGSRHVPAEVRRAVWKRDQGQCTFVSETGRRCEARRGLQFDHAQEFARGGEATVDSMRLRCWAHNQYQAERTFGSEFMRHKRIAAQERMAERRAASRRAQPLPVP